MQILSRILLPKLILSAMKKPLYNAILLIVSNLPKPLEFEYASLVSSISYL